MEQRRNDSGVRATASGVGAVSPDLTLSDEQILAIVQPTPDQLHEARLGIPAAMLEMDRELAQEAA